VRRKSGETTHLRKVGMVWWRGKMRLQAVLVAVMVLRTFGRWDENAGK